MANSGNSLIISRAVIGSPTVSLNPEDIPKNVIGWREHGRIYSREDMLGPVTEFFNEPMIVGDYILLAGNPWNRDGYESRFSSKVGKSTVDMNEILGQDLYHVEGVDLYMIQNLLIAVASDVDID